METAANKVKLSEDQVRFYDDNGYLIVPGVFEPEVCEAIKAHAEKRVIEDYSVLLNLHRADDFFFRIAKDPVLVDIVRAVQRREVVILNDQYLFKKPGTPYGKQAWNPHQDNAYAKARYGTYMQLHILLDAQSKENGGLFCYPGSHREEILPNEYVKSWREKVDDDGLTRPGFKLTVPEKYKRLDVEAPKGSIFLQHGNLIHGSYPNLTSDRTRAQYSLAYLNEGESFDPGRLSPRIPTPLK